MKWIFNSWQKDFLFLYAPTVLTALVCLFIYEDSAGFPFLAFLMLYVVDAGHSYITGWRVFRPGAQQDRKKSLYILAAVLIATLAWLSWGGYYFWPFVVYFTFFHHIRQIYGVSIWYERLNKSRLPYAGYIVQLLAALPFLAFHFRTDFSARFFYSPQDVFFYPSIPLLSAVIVLNILVLLFWLFVEGMHYQKVKKMEWNRILSMGFPALVSSSCFYLGRHFYEVAFPVIMLHGGVYIALVALSVDKVKTFKVGGLSLAIIIMTITALAAGAWELWMVDLFHLPSDMNEIRSLQIAAAAIIVVPGLWHYIVDGWIWKSGHGEAHRIYNN